MKKYIQVPQNYIRRHENMNGWAMTRLVDWAVNGFYRLNAGSADCYAFNPNNNDWDGGWDWVDYLVDKNVTYIFTLKDRKFFKVA